MLYEFSGSSREQIKNESFLSRVNEKQNVEQDSPVSSGVQGKYMKYVRFSWPPLEVELPLYNFRLFFVKI
jgi:hypothetical protein